MLNFDFSKPVTNEIIIITIAVIFIISAVGVLLVKLGKNKT